MKVFGDTVHFIALLSTGDRWHARAVAINRRPLGLLVTTEWVLTEVGDAFSQPGARQKIHPTSGSAQGTAGCGDRFIYKRSVPTRH
jgi:hypothetical protein